MKNISIRPVWTIDAPDAPPLPPRLLELLVAVRTHGSLLAACQQLGLSYRHGWDVVRQGEAHFGTALLHMERGKGSTLTALGDKLVWADQRIEARLRPVLDSLASELAAELRAVLADPPATLRLQASHGFAIEQLIERLPGLGVSVEHRYVSSTAAIAALHDGACDIAAFHLPTGELQAEALAHYADWFGPGPLAVIDIASRRQGLMVARGNPKKIYALADLLRLDVRFVNRQSDSGTRWLLEALLRREGLNPRQIARFEHGEFTHSAVAACVASGMADAGFGLQPPAHQFGLDFIALAGERYFLVCREELLASAPLQAVLAQLRSPGFRQVVDALPGYDAQGAGRVGTLPQAFGSAA